ncbi:MAG: DUF6351 family protein [Bermanella sp.]
MKKLLYVTLVLALCATSLGVFYDRLEQKMLPKSSDLLVLQLPENYRPKAIKASYSGPHPANLERPAETFKFPIAIGEVGPSEALFAGPKEYPFLCGAQRSGLGQPLVDNQDKIGISIFARDDEGNKSKRVLGYSQDCRLPTTIQYYVKVEDEQWFKKVEDMASLASEVSTLIRVETGTINRFIYMLALPVSRADTPAKFNPEKWNNRLIYRFKGGVGVGHTQGRVGISKILYEHEQQLDQGYAIAFSSGTQTSNHYDIWLSEDTALRVKRQFSSRYGKPLYTVGIGGSGGAIQQYLLSQNHPGIIDAAIPLYSYPDMVTQVGYALDCELMEYYFDVTSGAEKWQYWPNRRLVEGNNALQDFDNRYGNLQGIAGYLNGDFSMMPDGASQCTNGWRGPAQHINNPYFFANYYQVSRATLLQVDWSHWGNLSKFYGTHNDGFGKRFWDNQGIQYGLTSLLNKQLSIAEFIDLNRHIGGWKAPVDMENERFWHISGDDSLQRLSLWGHHNMTHDGNKVLAARSVGNEEAIHAAYQAGLVYLGLSDLPIIDMRHYLDHKLDMHHSLTSFTSRKRIQHAMGNSDHQLIWMIEKNDALARRDFMGSLPIDDALRVLDEWLINIKTHPHKGVAANRPLAANDRCYDVDKNVINSGAHTWDGSWNGKAQGPCMTRFPNYSHSRLMAGDSIYNDTLKCQRVSVVSALQMGVYGQLDMQPHVPQLERIFPGGVCLFNGEPHQQVRRIIKAIKEKNKG